MKRFATAILVLVSASWAHAQDSLRDRYAKQEVRIEMRDGKKLFTSIYAPKDASHPWPILLVRTPYGVGPYGEDQFRGNLGPSPLFAKEGFIFVYQDVRGRNQSEGEFVHVTPHRPVKSGPADIDESTDAYDTIDWLVKNLPNNNGRVGMSGISYPGFYAAAGAIDAHPALKAVSPQAPVSDWFIGDDFHHNGSFYLAHAFRFLDGFGRLKGTTRPKATTQDGYSFFLELGSLSEMESTYFKGDVPYWNEMRQHPSYDEWWKARNIRTHLRNMKPAMLEVGGWFDAEDLFGALRVYDAIERQSPGATNTIVMGPWFHGGWAGSDGESLGHVRFGSKTSVFFREEIEFPFFCHYLKDRPDPKLPEAYMFETGSNRWRKFDAWPPATVARKALYFHADGRLSFEPPAEPSAYDEYVSDPAKPVPYIGSQASGMTREHMVDDQRFAASRPDVLSYRTEPLEQDLTIAGGIVPSLRVSTSGTDSDWVVKLIDVYPDDTPDPVPPVPGLRMGGFQQLLRGECMRGRFRNSYEKPEPFEPGKVEKVEYVMPDVLHTFLRGHRIMVQVQSSWFPLVDRNPQKYVDIYQARSADFQKATERVYRSAAEASSVQIQILN